MSTALVRAAATLLLLGWFPVAASAAPLEDYHDRIWQAISIADAVYEGDESVSIDDLTRLLPPRETVEVADASIEVNNAWLAGSVAEYQGATDVGARSSALDTIVRRLYAMEQAVASLKETPEHATDADRKRLEEVLARPEFAPPKPDPLAAKIREWQHKIAEFLGNLLQKLFGGKRASTYSSGLRVVILAVGIVALAIVVRALAQAVARRKPGEKRRKKKKVVLGEVIDETTTSADLAAAARALADNGDYRGAIRKLFVALIYELDERGAVALRSETTNREYLRLVRGLGALYPVMTTMTDIFERIWYGSEHAERVDFDEFARLHAEARSSVPVAALN